MPKLAQGVYGKTVQFRFWNGLQFTLNLCKKNSLVLIWQSFPFSLRFSSPSSLVSSSFIAAVARFRSPFIPSFLGSGSPSWDSNCYIVGKRGTPCLPQWFWEKRNCRDFVRLCSHSLGNGYLLGICLWSAHVCRRLIISILLVPFG